METLEIIDLFRDAIFLVILLVSILVIPGLILGLFVSVFQAATQINEQSLSFVPRLLITFLTLLVTAPLLIRLVTDFTFRLFEILPSLVN